MECLKMNKRNKIYCELMYIVNDVYKLNERDYIRTFEELKILNKKVHIEEYLNLLTFVKNVNNLMDKKIDYLMDLDKNLRIKSPFDNYEYLDKAIRKFRKVLNGVMIDFELLMIIIIPSLIIQIDDKFEIFDFNGDLGIDNRILKIIKEIDLKEDICSICLEKFDGFEEMIMSCCCCDKMCNRCYNLNNNRCAICKGDKTIIINI